MHENLMESTRTNSLKIIQVHHYAKGDEDAQRSGESK